MRDLAEKEERERADARFNREELGALLRLFSSLGLVVAAGIAGALLLGIHLDRELAARGLRTYGLMRVALVFLGVAATVYWAYLRIASHLDRFGGGGRKE